MHRYEWVIIRGVWTFLLKLDVESESTKIHSIVDSPPLEYLVVIVPGNPGSVQYYQEFAVTLWNALGRRVAIWGISHAGHVFHDELHTEKFDDSVYPELEFQIEHKKSFIENIVPSTVRRIILIGHSIGAYICLQTADRMKDSRIVRVIGLFPTIEKMALTPSGRLFTPAFKYGKWLFFALAVLTSWLPERLCRFLIRKHMPGISSHNYDGVYNLCRYPSFRNCILMANDEMEKVTEIEGELLENNISKLILYYGQNDHWCPKEFYFDMKKRFPDAQVHFCDKGFEHAFVLKDSRAVAEMVATWLQNDDEFVGPTVDYPNPVVNGEIK